MRKNVDENKIENFLHACERLYWTQSKLNEDEIKYAGKDLEGIYEGKIKLIQVHDSSVLELKVL